MKDLDRKVGWGYREDKDSSEQAEMTEKGLGHYTWRKNRKEDRFTFILGKKR